MLVFHKLTTRYRERGFWALLTYITRKTAPHLSFVGRMMHKFVLSYLRKHYDYVIQRYKHYTPSPSASNRLPEYEGVIWSMWWQGEENLPKVVQLCRASLKRHCGNHKIIIITKDNYKDYVTLPEHIISKVQAGYISLTHLSDIIRAELLVKYGGLWIDSTIFVADGHS